MARVPSLSSPFLLGFDEIERALDRVAKAADGYPPYNIERMVRENGRPERLRITLAVAGFAPFFYFFNQFFFLIYFFKQIFLIL